jgi:autotransporter strand-loop-strand O-heptosyltransferase
MTIQKKFDRSFLLCGDKNYLPIIKKTIKSIRSFSDLPIFVYLINHYDFIDEKNVFVKKWICQIRNSNEELFNVEENGNFYIDRNRIAIYDTLIQRSVITKDVLENFTNTVCYLDSDTICLPNIEKIFDLYPKEETVPYFTKGVYDFMYWDGVGGTGDDLTKTLEHPICELYNIDQSFRYQSGYRQTGYYLAGQNTIPFITEWVEMCSNPIIKNETVKYAAYHEETIVNCLLWKHKIDRGLPSVYVNGSLETIDLINNKTTFIGEPNFIKDWVLVPSKREELFFIHGEKRLNVIDSMIEKLKGVYYKDKKIADVGYVINLPHRTDRKENVIKLLNELDITGYEFIDGVILENPEYKKFGCTAAFINAFEKFLSTEAETVIVFEDDIKLMNNVSKNDVNNIFNNWSETISNYDVVALGTKLLPRSEIKIVGKTHGSFEEMLCAQSFFYHRHFVEHLFTIMKEYSDKNSPFNKCAIDMFLNDCSSSNYRFIHNDKHKKFKFGITIPMIFTQAPTLSDNEGKIQDYEDEMESAFWKSLNKNKKNKMKLLYLTPHLSTGGMPQFVLKRIQELQKHKDKIELFLVEFSQFSDEYVVQRNEIIELLDDGHFFTLGTSEEKNRKYELMDIIKNNNIDIIHSEEMVEGFEGFNRIPLDLLNQLYSNDRTWKIIETCHNVWFNPETNKKFNPDAYCFVTPYHQLNTFASTPSMKFLLTYPYENKVKPLLEKYEIFNNLNRVPMIEKISVCEELGIDPFKTHVLNIGLWTSGKNQSEGVEVARRLVETNPNVQFHFVGNQAPNFENYWGPIMKNLPSNVKVWGERNDVDTFMKACDVLMFNSTWECNPLVVRESINYGMKVMARDLPQYMGMFNGYIKPIEGDVEHIANDLVELINDKRTYEIPNDESFGDDLLSMYTIVANEPIWCNDPLKNDYTFITYNINQPFFEIQGQTENNLDIKIYNNDTNQLYYNNTLPINSWVKLNREYFTNWRYEVYENGDLIYNKVLDLKGKRVFIPLSSKSLGDTLAWFPYVDEFRKKHNCHVITSTFMNYLFVDQYPELEFVEPGEVVNNIHAQYNFGWFYDENGNVDYNKNPNDFRVLPLQKTASDILGLDYEEIRPKLNLPNVEKKKKVGIGLHSTAQAKYWNNPNGWQEVVDYLNGLGYECMVYSKEGDGYMGNNYPKGVTIYKGGNLQEVINDLSTCEFFIGLGSGLSWLAWACNLPVVLISGFSEKWAETKLDTFRVINENVCHGCFNKERLDAGDWNWCPLHKGTDRQFECTKQISSEMVINEINKLLNNNPLPNFDWGWMDKGSDNGDYHKHAMYNEIFEQRLYEQFFEVEKGDIVLDLGASVGPFTYSILHKKPKHVFCVEPSESEFTTLIKNTLGHPVTHINKGLFETNGIVEHDELFGGETHMESITFDRLVRLYGLNRIDFVKTDCEGGEYEMFKIENLPFIKQNVKKIVGEWHLCSPENKVKFRNFRDNILTQFDKYEVFSVDGVNIKWNLWNEEFIEYYCEVIVYIDNR